LIIEKGESVTNAKIILQQRKLPSGSFPCNSELRPTGFLTVEEVANCFDRL
jgi:hypothetical protein